MMVRYYAASACLTALRLSTDLPDGTSLPRHMVTRGDIGLRMNAPRRPANLPFLPDDRTYNRTVNQIRYMSERDIANIKP
ncbi:hypothetical protein [Actinomyces naeslundii]|uniref:hypothetical protein n=1 Tax=Actinomyces naeslundii TaxID=1655 RepID=UPI0011787910|nr:hypothetical protein [Actinomyces naeslundii]